MNLKKKLRDFFTLTRKANEGFTLVELIVVIAILAILAGVAVPAYNGYIEKVNKAADETLIAAINKAAAAAVLDEMGEDMVLLNDEALSSNAVKNKTGISVWKRYDEGGPVETAFAEYFEDNESAALKWYGSLKFEGGRFVGVESILKAGLVVPDGSTVKTTFNASSYADLGVDGMTEMVDTLAGALSEYGGLSSLTETAAFEETLRKLGIDPDTADKQTKANASVFYLADYIDQIGEKVGEEKIWEHMVEGDLQTWLVSDEVDLGLDGNDATFFDTAIQYAAATAYAYSGIAPENVADIIRNANPSTNGEALGYVTQVTTANPDAWQGYQSFGGEEDFFAFFEVMEVVNASNSSFSTFEGSDYFSNEELRAAINGILTDPETDAQE